MDSVATPVAAPAHYIVRHGAMRWLGDYEAITPEARYARGQQVVLRTARGQELGDVLSPSTPQAVAMIQEPTTGQIVRPVSDADRARAEQIMQGLKREFELA